MNESDIDRLLRQETPAVPLRPGLETRIRASLRSTPKPERYRLAWLAWLSLPALSLVAFSIVAVSRNQPAPPVTLTVIETPAEPSRKMETSVVPELIEDKLNPIRSETLALQSDAERTGRFLLDCLPSLALSEK